MNKSKSDVLNPQRAKGSVSRHARMAPPARNTFAQLKSTWKGIEKRMGGERERERRE